MSYLVKRLANEQAETLLDVCNYTAHSCYAGSCLNTNRMLKNLCTQTILLITLPINR